MGSSTRLLTAKQVKERTGLPVATIYWMGQNNMLPLLRIGRSVRFPEAALVEWIERNTVAEKSPDRGGEPPMGSEETETP